MLNEVQEKCQNRGGSEETHLTESAVMNAGNGITANVW